MPRRLVFLNEAEGLSIARPRVSKPDRSFRNQNCGGRAWIQVPLQPCLSRSCAPDLCMCVQRRGRAASSTAIFHRGQEAALPSHP